MYYLFSTFINQSSFFKSDNWYLFWLVLIRIKNQHFILVRIWFQALSVKNLSWIFNKFHPLFSFHCLPYSRRRFKKNLGMCQCCRSGINPGSKFLHPGSRILHQNDCRSRFRIHIFYPKNCKLSDKLSVMLISDLGSNSPFFSIPDPGVKKHQIPDPNPQH